MENEVKKALDRYKALGGWWSYDPKKVPEPVKEYIAGTIKEFDRIAEEISHKLYAENAPELRTYRQIKDWG